MTHRDIYTKFMIEYDKALFTSSYPSLTEYEVATVLDKAYNALIAQKVTGNNYRRIPFEADIKAISDLQPLVVYEEYSRAFSDNAIIKNQLDFKIPDDFLYYVGCRLEGELYKQGTDITNTIKVTHTGTDEYIPIFTTTVKPEYAFIIPISYIQSSNRNVYFPYDDATIWYVADLTTALTDDNKIIYKIGQASTYLAITGENVTTKTALLNAVDSIGNLHNTIIMWPNTWKNNNTPLTNELISNCVLYTTRSKTTSDKAYPYDRETYRTLPCQIVDYNTAQKFFTSAYNMPWIKNPICYIHGNGLHVVKEDDDISNYVTLKCVLTYIKKPNTFVKNLLQSTVNQNFFDDTPFELNNTMAEELISLGIAIALENIESPRLNSKLNMRGLEA